VKREEPKLMKRVYVTIAFLTTMTVAALGIVIWTRYLDELSVLKHDTNRWAVIQDVNRDRMAVEPLSDEVWSQLVQLSQSGTRRFVGGIVERYDNKWGFRFRPDTVTVAEFTAEGLQATIRYISENLNNWLNGWAYISAKVLEVHS